jgi:hypothetical protein
LGIMILPNLSSVVSIPGLLFGNLAHQLAIVYGQN